MWVRGYGICVNSSIMDKGGTMKTNSLHAKGMFIPIESHHSSATSLMPFPK